MGLFHIGVFSHGIGRALFILFQSSHMVLEAYLIAAIPQGFVTRGGGTQRTGHEMARAGEVKIYAEFENNVCIED